MELKATVEVSIVMKDGETFGEAESRLYDLLYDGLCNNAEAEMEFWNLDIE